MKMLNESVFIDRAALVKDAIKQLDKVTEKVLLVVAPDRKLLGTITDGDVRRYILKGRSLEEDIENLYNARPRCLKKADISPEKLREMFIEKQLILIPIIDDEGRVTDSISASKTAFTGKDLLLRRGSIDVPVVIMAGGRGTRLEPFSKIFPKALIPVGEKPMIEVIIDEFKKQGADDFYITLNYKGEMIESYFNNVEKDYRVTYVRENDFLGTAGSLGLLADKLKDTFVVSNCDVVVRADFSDVLKFHRDHDAYLTVLSSIQHHKIPYGIVKFKEGGEMTDISEKPEYTFSVNTGVCILDKKTLDFIPAGMRFDMTDLMKDLMRKGKKVVTYPVNESDYMDIGHWEEYCKAIEKMEP